MNGLRTHHRMPEMAEVGERAREWFFRLVNFFVWLFGLIFRGQRAQDGRDPKQAQAKKDDDFAKGEAKAREEATEDKEKEEVERIEREAKEKAEQEAKEKAEREAKERAEREAKEKAEREAKEKAEREAKEKAEREAKEKAEHEA